MGGNVSANHMLTGGEGGSKKPNSVLTLYVYLPYGFQPFNSLSISMRRIQISYAVILLTHKQFWLNNKRFYCDHAIFSIMNMN